MADTETETDPAQAAAAAVPAKSPSPWGPVIAMIVLMPAITYGMAEFLILPKIRGVALEKEVHGAAAKKEGGGHGEAKGAHGKGAEESTRFTYDFDNIVVNLSGAMGTRYLKTSFTAYSENAELKKIIEENKKQLLDVAITVLGSRTLADLEQPGAKNVVRSDLTANFNQAMKSDLIGQIYFSEFVVQ